MANKTKQKKEITLTKKHKALAYMLGTLIHTHTHTRARAHARTHMFGILI